MTIHKQPKKQSLGAGLAALIGPEVDSTNQTFRELSIDRLMPGKYQPRTYIDGDSLQELSDSIKENGVIQPIVVRDFGDQFEIIAGERRWRASKLAGLTTVPVIIKDLSDKQSLEIAIIENIQREDLNVLEEAKGYERLMNEFSYTQEVLSTMLGKSRSHIANTLRLLRLPEEVQVLVREKKLTPGHARALLTHPDPLGAAKDVIQRHLTVRQTEQLSAEPKPAKAPRLRSQDKYQGQKSGDLDGDLVDMQQMLAAQTGLAVTMHSKGQGGEITLAYDSFDALDRFMTIISDGSGKIL